MAIEKMALVRVEGALKRVNKALMKCCESKCFHIINTSRGGEKEGDRRLRSLKSKNPYAPLVNRARALADGLGIEMKEVDYEDVVGMNVSVNFDNYLGEVEQRLKELLDKKREIENSLKDHSEALMLAERLTGFDVKFSELFACQYIKTRFGRLPLDSLPKLEYYSERNFIYYHFNDDEKYSQILYITPVQDSAEIDDIFNSLFFERTRVPDYFEGDADEAKTEMLKLVREENNRMDMVDADIKALRLEIEENFLKVVSKLIALDESYHLRQNVLAVNNKFFMSGYVPKRRLKEFIASVQSVPDVQVEEKPLDSEPNSSPPVLLRNNWLFRPFEMFVKMYGLPNYKCFDPTPYVAVTFMLIFGIMFGDVGQGLLITVLGIILDKWRKVKLAPIMQRIGITSAIFGVLYGSVFGNEELIEPFFKIPNVYQALGYIEAPADIFQVSTILLLAAIGIGVVLVMISMLMNIFTNIRTSDWLSEAVISPNGVTGLIFYAAVMVGVALQLGLGVPVFSAPYVICLILLPLALLFFKEPIIHLFGKKGKQGGKNNNIIRSVKTYSDSISDLPPINGSEEMLEEFTKTNFVKAQYGYMEISAYKSLKNRNEKSYIFYPFEHDDEIISGVYVAQLKDFPVVDKKFAELGFKKMKMPEHIEDIRKEQNLRLADRTPAEKKEKKSVGNFIIEGIIELFESCLTYITNTMSFLRIGGFILSHAGMMLVVSVLAAKAGDGAGAIIVQILGNLFVIGMEGFLVGIQVLRLEFYEVFSRFYKGDGKPFSPVVANFSSED